MSQTVLETRGLTKRYGSLLAVDNLSLQVYESEIFGLLGPNGAGKTTTINIICGLLHPDAGSVILHGMSIQNSDGGLRSKIGVCPQQPVLWEKLTCLEQLEFVGEMYGLPGQLARRRGHELLERLGLAEKRDKLAGSLSGGMKRRLNLCLALVHDPEIIVLDEPEAGLDPQSRVLVREYIHSLADPSAAKPKTVLLTTHNMDEADRLADRVAIIDHGRLLVVDTPEALKRTVGEGDVLEIELSGISPEQAIQKVSAIAPGALTTANTLIIRGHGIVERLPAILAALGGAVGQPGAVTKPGEVRLRANTLEDVFIQLTGRSIRE